MVSMSSRQNMCMFVISTIKTIFRKFSAVGYFCWIVLASGNTTAILRWASTMYWLTLVCTRRPLLGWEVIHHRTRSHKSLVCTLTKSFVYFTTGFTTDGVNVCISTSISELVKLCRCCVFAAECVKQIVKQNSGLSMSQQCVLMVSRINEFTNRGK